MTIVICENEDHENTAGVNVCPHIHLAMSGKNTTSNKIAKINFSLNGEIELSASLCSLCATELKIENEAILELGAIDAETVFNRSNKIVCSSCFSEKYNGA